MVRRISKNRKEIAGMSNQIRVYELYPVPVGGFSNRTDDYSGTRVAVAASSSKQAHDLAGSDVWAAAPDEPLGILWVARRGEAPDHRLFNGDRRYGNHVGHGAGKQAIATWMRAIIADSPSRPSTTSTP
jgi:hypothetical protein